MVINHDLYYCSSVMITRDPKIASNATAKQPHKYFSTCTYVEFYNLLLHYYEICGPSDDKLTEKAIYKM